MALLFTDTEGDNLGTINFGTLKPGEKYSVKNGSPFVALLGNTGPGNYEDASVRLGPVANFPSVNYLLIAVTPNPSTPPDPEDWQSAADGPIDTGPIAALDSVAVWVDADVPLSADAGRAQLARLIASGTREE